MICAFYQKMVVLLMTSDFISLQSVKFVYHHILNCDLLLQWILKIKYPLFSVTTIKMCFNLLH